MNDNSQGIRKNQQKASSAPGAVSGVFIGNCVRISGGVYITIPTATKGEKIIFGPCKTVGLYPAVGDRVLCTFLENRNDEVVVLGKVIQSNVLTNTGTPTVATHATTKEYVDSKAIVLQNQINTLTTALTALTNRYNSHIAHPPPA